jgi:glucose-1-phosphate thymidylyltransferase
MKGIVLAAGSGTRLLPLTKTFNKQLLPIFDKPLIYYPISTLMLAGIRDILIITTINDQPLFKKLLGDGKELGIKFTYLIQNSPKGIAEAFLIAENFIGGDNVALILGDNVFFGTGLGTQLKSNLLIDGALIFTYKVNNPSQYGIAILDSHGQIIDVQEKPIDPKTNLAITGLYIFDNSVISKAKTVKPSNRDELEITDINKLYLIEGKLSMKEISRGIAWLDTGTFEALHDASTFVRVIEERQGNKIACLEEIAWRNGWITSEDLNNLSKDKSRLNIKKYLNSLLTN